ncbi:MAG: winged helix-turn-helix domain-containing protein, partial [Acidimicrobiia bacterium]|nr:winged helix-turn-helix domain-containing protein [Acidimicrobiia bacterium]
DGRLVDVHVRRLRTKVEGDPANPRHVVTVRGLGYKLQT